MKIVLVNLPWFKSGRLGVRGGSRWPFTCSPGPEGRLLYVPFPFFLAYSASLLKKHGHSVTLIDAIAQELGERECLEKIRECAPDLVAAEISTPSFNNDMRLIEQLRGMAEDARIAVCGPHAGVFAREILLQHPAVEYVCIGEYEQTLLELSAALRDKSSLEGVPGLAYRGAGDVILTSARTAGAGPLDLPWPERTAPLIYNYNDGFAGMPVPNVQMLASRGCPFGCTFCLLPQTLYRGNGYRKRDHRDVIDEMEYLIREFGFKAVYFDDEVFNADRGYVIELCEEMIRRGISIPWAAMTRVDLMDEGLLRVMQRSGLYAVKYGIESADAQIRAQCNKRLDLEKARAVIDITRHLGVKVHLTFCLGLPGETRQTVQETVDFVHAVSPESFQFTFATPYPGTEYFRYAREKGWIGSLNWDDYDGNDRFIVRTEALTMQDLEEVKAELLDRFKGKCCCM